jgi:hypothetical protein
MIPDRFLSKDPKPEGKESKNSCIDKIDNDFDGEVDFKDGSCFN